MTIFQPSETLDIAARERYKLERRLVIICLEEGEKCGWKRWRKLECGEWLTTIVAPRFFDCSLDFGNGRWPFPVDPCESSTVVGLEHDDEATLVLEGLVLLHRFRHSSVLPLSDSRREKRKYRITTDDDTNNIAITEP